MARGRSFEAEQRIEIAVGVVEMILVVVEAAS